MNQLTSYLSRIFVLILICCFFIQGIHAQTDVDAVMLKKKIFCVGGMYSRSSWKDYWEGTFKRNNENLGEVSTQMFAVMGAYGITNKLNLLFAAPFVSTKATEGTLKGFKGVQDLSLMLKYQIYTLKIDNNDRFSIFGVGKVSIPLTNYVADYLPLSIGMHSKNAGIRAMLDYQHGNFFATASSVYTVRSNVKIDRTSYYTTEMHNTNMVDMPDMFGFNYGIGYRDKRWNLEAVYEIMRSNGGFDIRKNDMPFPSNEMNADQVGLNAKYTMHKIKGLEITGGGRYVVKGRNVGQSTSFSVGVFYLMDLAGKRKTKTNINN